MKKSFVLFVVVFISYSCNNSGGEKPAASIESSETSPGPAPSPAEKVVVYPFEVSFASDWVVGDPEHAANVLYIYKNLVENKSSDSSLRYFADSLTSISFDDNTFKGTKSEFLKKVKEFRGQFKTLEEDVVSIVSLYSPSKDVNQVCIWVKEKGIRMNGKPDSSLYQENWRFDKAGKIYFRSVFARYGF